MDRQRLLFIERGGSPTIQNNIRTKCSQHLLSFSRLIDLTTLPTLPYSSEPTFSLSQPLFFRPSVCSPQIWLPNLLLHHISQAIMTELSEEKKKEYIGILEALGWQLDDMARGKTSSATQLAYALISLKESRHMMKALDAHGE